MKVEKEKQEGEVMQTIFKLNSNRFIGAFHKEPRNYRVAKKVSQ